MTNFIISNLPAYDLHGLMLQNCLDPGACYAGFILGLF